MVTFWVGIGAIVLPWWLDTPAGAVSSATEGLIEAGRVTGLLAGYVLLLQILMMSRVSWLERRIGATEILGWHRDLGGLLVFLVLAHIALITVGYAGADESSLLHETLTLMHTYKDM